MWTDSSRPRSSRQLHTWPWLDEQRALRCGAAAGMAPVCHGGLRLYRGAATLSTPCGEPHKTRPAPRSLSVVVARDPQVTHEHVRKTPPSVLSYVPTIRQSVSHGFWSVVTEASRPRGPVSGITWLPNEPPCAMRSAGAGVNPSLNNTLDHVSSPGDAIRCVKLVGFKGVTEDVL